MSRISGAQDDDGLLASLGRHIRELRVRRNLSQEALADASGIDRSHMGKIERGERNVTILNLARIAKALGCNLSELIAGSAL
ncbi:helix-turn-helix transcriptional regulator [Brevundimonas sp. A19_0]|nr:helix-turn-helix transcriptional regulator [Brevundimonas sp. A19_0]MBO9500666.1 helix-turn-helix transcriptional regulator [Brevundimonas sp. A19_0]